MAVLLKDALRRNSPTLEGSPRSSLRAVANIAHATLVVADLVALKLGD